MLNDQQTTSTPSNKTILEAAYAFPVPWLGCTEEGHIKATHCKFRVLVPPTDWFGQNLVDENVGEDKALAIAEASADPEPHNFGVCTIRRNSIRQLDTGEWVMDLKVQKRYQRKLDAMLQDKDKETGKPIGEPYPGIRAETWITVFVTQVEPAADAPLSLPYLQTNSDATSTINLNRQSASIAAGRKKSERAGRSRKTTTRVLPPNVAAFLASKKSS